MDRNASVRHGNGGAPSLSGNPPPELTPEQEGNVPQITNASGFEAVVLKPNMGIASMSSHHRDHHHGHDDMLPPGQALKR